MSIASPTDQVKARRTYRKKYYWKHHAEELAYRARYRAANKEKISSRGKLYFKERGRAKQQERRTALRREVLAAYGSKCQCCGETEFQFLAVDHIDGGGAKHRRETSNNVYQWLKKHDYPTGYQILCHNCNMAKGLYNQCPHNQTW